MPHAPLKETDAAAVSDRLREAGYRVTRQRMAVYAYLSGNTSHPTVEDIHTGVRDAFPKMSLATVYKSLESLVDVGVVKPIHLGSAATRYDATTDAHGHFRCIACNEITDVPLDRRPAVGRHLDRFQVVGTTVEYYGFCSACRKEKRPV